MVKKNSSGRPSNPNRPQPGPGDRIRSGQPHPKKQAPLPKQSGVSQPRKGGDRGGRK